MKIEKINAEIVSIYSDKPIIENGQSALDMMMNIKYETGCEKLIINKEAFSEAFFNLASGVAGDVLQKFINYQTPLAIYGDFSGYTSKALKDFMYESNMSNKIAFVQTVEDAASKLK